MLLVIFGAGASYDSAQPFTLGDRPPPLAKDLASDRFNGIAAEYPASKPIIDRLRTRMVADETRSLETELARLVSHSGDRPERREQLIAFRFYLQQVIRDTTEHWFNERAGFTYYLTLINRLFDEQEQTGPVRLATFNYDMMLETALQTVFHGWRATDNLEAYVELDDFQIFKLHGSISWSRVLRVSGMPAFASTIESGMAAARDGVDFRVGGIVAQSPPLNPPSQVELLVPAMALPIADKTDFECPDTHLDKLRRDMSSVDRVLIVGWRAAEAHAVELFNAIPPGFVLLVASGSADDTFEVLDNLGSDFVGKARQIIQVPEGFGALIEGLDDYMAELLVG